MTMTAIPVPSWVSSDESVDILDVFVTEDAISIAIQGDPYHCVIAESLPGRVYVDFHINRGTGEGCWYISPAIGTHYRVPADIGHLIDEWDAFEYDFEPVSFQATRITDPVFIAELDRYRSCSVDVL